MRALALFMVISLFHVLPVQAESTPSIIASFKHFIFDDPPQKPHLNPVRPTMGKPMSECIETLPYNHSPLIEDINIRAREMANTIDAAQETLSFQPHFSGLKGPKLTIMRRDLERALIHNRGSAQEIYHNAAMSPATPSACNKALKTSWDIELRHHIDVFESDRSPLSRSNLIVNNRLNFGGYFLGTSSINTPLYDNLERDNDLRILNRTDPIRQDVLGFAWQGLNIERLMLSGFATPKPNLYIAGHAGYLEEMFFGLGGELLYRPNNSPFAIGMEAWGTMKRTPYLGSWTTLDDDNTQTSALLNLWYDMPTTPLTFGLSGGRFLDGDYGGMAKAVYKPAQGWSIEGYATYSNEREQQLDGDTSHMIAGLRLTMPLGQFKGLPDNSHQTIDIAPFARDKGQRIDNAYPLYDLTDPWHTKNIYRDWNRITKK